MMGRAKRFFHIGVALAAIVPVLLFGQRGLSQRDEAAAGPDANAMFQAGRDTFRYDTFGDEAFWGDTIKVHQAIEGTPFGGIGPGVSPKTALAVGLKVDADALPASLVGQVQNGQVNLDDPATTLALLKLNAVVGVTGFFNSDGSLKSLGIQCAICHSTVDNSFSTQAIPAGNIGHRLDGWPNRDLNVGAIINLSPDLTPVAKLLGVDEGTVRKVLLSWGPGKFDASLLMDGKGFRPDGKSAATLIPPAYGLAGFNLATWTGWGSVTYWNAFVATLEMHGKGRFFDPRLDNADQFPIAAKNHFGDVRVDPQDDRVTPKLAALHFYQLAIPAPKPAKNPLPYAEQRGAALFNGKAQCSLCHTPGLWTEPGHNLHTPAEVCVDDFQANRSPEKGYRTAPLAGIFFRQKGGFYHDGRFATLLDVVNHYNDCRNMQLTEDEKNDLVQYVLTL